MQLLTPCMILAETNARTSVSVDEVEEINSLFFDAKRSAKMLAEADTGAYLM